MHNTIIHCNHNVLIKHVHVVAIKLKVPNEFIPLLNKFELLLLLTH